MSAFVFSIDEVLVAKIPLTVDKNYCSRWGVWSGIRELIQNAKDADEYDERPMTINHFPRSNRLEIVNANVQVNPANLLVLGKTSKGDGRYRGKFGEGFVLGVLALVRSGHDVKFRNHEMSWSVSFEAPDPDHPLAGNELLTFHSRKLPTREPDFVVEIHGVSVEVWNELKKLALFVEEPKAAETIKTRAGTLLLNEAYKGRVFVRGLFVRAFEDLECGYDLSHVQLDRDRQMIDEFQLHYQLGDLWTRACDEDRTLEQRVYDMMKTGKTEVRHLHYHADQKLLSNIRDLFVAEHGQDAVPVATSVEAKEVSKVGGKPAVVATTLKDLLAPMGLSVEAAKKKLEGTITRRWAPADLCNGPEADDEAYEKSCRLEAILPNTVVVTFGSETPACHLIDDKKVIGVDRRLLDKPFKDVLGAALVEEAQRVGKTPLDVLLAHVAGEPIEPAVESKSEPPEVASETPA